MRTPISVNPAPEMRVERDARMRARAAYHRLRMDSPDLGSVELAEQEWLRYVDEEDIALDQHERFVKICASTLRGLLTSRARSPRHPPDWVNDGN